MKQYTIGKKMAVLVLHQLFMILTIVSVYYSGYLFQMHIFLGSDKSGILTVISFVGSLVFLAYLTSVAGRKAEDDPVIYYSSIDKIDSDVLVLLFIFFAYGIIVLMHRIELRRFELSGLMVAVGTLTYMIDAVFLLFYMSIVRRIKGNILWTQSLIYKGYRLLLELADQRSSILKYSSRRIYNVLFLIVGVILYFNGFHKIGILFIVLVCVMNVFQNMKRTSDQIKIHDAVNAIAAGALDTRLSLDDFKGQEREIAQSVNNIRAGLSEAVNESIRNERMKADLITNVSHDIKTPLTSIVNYVDLLKRENLQNDNARYYIRVLDEKSQRLKQLTEDLVEASRISSGNVHLDMQKIDLVELLYQTGGEFNERFEARNLTIVTKIPNQSIFIWADGRHLYRAIENLYTNASKYALEKTRVYVELYIEGGEAVFSIKNISKKPVETDEGGRNDLTERFVRGESSRTTEGSGLGLSIAKNLTVLMGGKFDISVDGDLFIATIRFPESA